jgi:hypothetical protein
MSIPPPPSDHEALPVLTPDVVEDDVALGEWVDAVVGADLDARERMYEIARLAEAVRAILDEDTWKLFLLYDERANERFAELLLVVAKFAFRAGRRFPLSIEEPDS